VLLDLRDGKVLEPYFNQETGKTEYLATAAKTRLEACRLLLAYSEGTPTPQGTDALERRVIELEERLAKELGRPLHRN
jgi:hypothetical protein